MRGAPGQVSQRHIALAEKPGQLGSHDAGHPAHDEAFAAGEAFRVVQHPHGVAHPADAHQQWHSYGDRTVL